MNPENEQRVSIQCRIDSGADEITLPAEAGIMLGIELATGEPLAFRGIAHDPVKGYRHLLEMRSGAIPIPIRFLALWCRGYERPAC
jgi:hypothetical protein